MCWAGVDLQKFWWSSVDLYWSKACSSWKEALNLNQIFYCAVFIQGILFIKCKYASVGMYLQARQGTRSCLFNFATGIRVLATGFIVVLLESKLEQAGLVLSPALEGYSGSGTGGALAAPIHAAALAPEAGSDCLSRLKGCGWGFGWVCSNNSLSREGDGFPPLVQPMTQSLCWSSSPQCALCKQDCKTPWQTQISSFFAGQANLDSRFKRRFLCT